MIRRFMLTAALVLSALSLSANAFAQGPIIEVRHDQKNDETLLSVRAKNAPFRELIGVIAFELEAVRGQKIEVQGLDKLVRNPRVDAFLVDRPWRESLRWLAGAADLSVIVTASSIKVSEALPDYPTANELRMRALLTYRSISNDYPDSALAAEILLESGKLSIALGPDFQLSAKDSFERLMEDFPTSEFLWEAMFLSAKVYESMGDWEKAALRYHEVADAAAMHAYHVDARRALAIALCEVGERQDDQPLAAEENGQKAVITMQALDRYYPTDRPLEQRQRALITGRALALSGKPVEALRALDIAAKQSSGGGTDVEVTSIRAKALSRAGRHGDASTAWLSVSRHTTGEALEYALIEAAREALEGGHELAVLAIHRQAEKHGLGRRLEHYEREAKLRLGIDAGTDGYSPSQQLARAMLLAQRGMSAEAVRAMRRLHIRRSELSAADRVELALGFARALNKEDLPREAIETLRVVAGETENALERRRIYTLAAQIHELRGDYDAAINALQGKL